MKDWQIYIIAVIVLPIVFSFVYHYDKSGVGSFQTAYEGMAVVGIVGGVVLIFYRLRDKIRPKPKYRKPRYKKSRRGR